MTLTAARLLEVMDYDPGTGVFRWKTDRRSGRIGRVAGSPHPKGYITITIDRRHYLAHRLAWLWKTGDWPKDQVDHKNMNRADNSWDNLREATQTQNNANTGLRGHNTSGFKGVYWNKQRNRWGALIAIHKKSKYLGFFDDPAAAGEAYAIAAKELYREFSRP